MISLINKKSIGLLFPYEYESTLLSFPRRWESISVLLLLFFGFCASANDNNISYKQDGLYRIVTDKHLINDIPLKNKGDYQMIVEIPSGTRQKWEVNHKSGQIEWEFKDGKPREVKFLAYPGNYGFLPQTLSGDNDPLDIIVLSEAFNRGDIIEVKVLGMLKLSDGGESDNKVIAITEGSGFKKIDSLSEMLVKEPNVIPIIRQWFEGYKTPGKIVFLGYEEKKKTIEYIERAHKKWKSNQK